MLLRILVGVVVVAAFFGGTLTVMNFMSPDSADGKQPALVEVPPLPPLTRTSVVIAPAAIALTAIRDAIDAAAPRNLAGKKDNNLFKELLSNADIGWTIARGPLSLAGRPETLTVTTPLNGSFRATGQIATQAGNLGGTLGGLVSQDIGRGLQNVTGKALDQRADVRGNVIVTSRPAIIPNWRLEPNLTGQAALNDVSLSILGVKLNVGKELKPLIDKSVAEQMASLQLRLRNDPFIEQAARREWAKMCRSVSLGAGGAGLPNLWLEIRPTRAFAAQPRIDANAVTLTMGAQMETRVVPAETKPNCPFPPNVELVAPMDQGRVNIATPIDVPFTEINKLLDAQLTGKKFPEDGSGSVEVLVRRATVAASGDRLLISLQVKASEKKFFTLGAEGVVHIWGKPLLDREQQILRLTDIVLAVESETAFGLVGAAARAAAPKLQAALAQRAVIDLKPFAANARKSIDAAVAEFRKQEEGVRIDASITDLRLVGIAFDATTLRVITEADGVAKVTVSSLPAQ
jgi:hypothetical protein